MIRPPFGRRANVAIARSISPVSARSALAGQGALLAIAKAIVEVLETWECGE
jgi:hypothetical protein